MSFGTNNGKHFQFDMTQIKFSTAGNGIDLIMSGTGVIHETGGAYADTAAAITFGFSGNNTNEAASFATTAAVPIPAAIYLLGPATVGMVGLMRRFHLDC